MSHFGQIYEKPPIHLIDGVVREKTIMEFAYQIEAGFEAVGDLIGNAHGLGVQTAEHSRFINSLSSAIGDMDKVSQNEPFGVSFSSYIQNFVNDGTKKDYTLDIIPDLGTPGSVTINAPDDASVTWTHRNTLEGLTSEGDYNISGRVITFYQVPTNLFSIIYDGDYPSFSSTSSGYMPNVYPSPELVESGVVTKPLLNRVSNGRLRVEVPQTNYNSEGKAFGANLELEFNTSISQYISSIGATECPQELISAWVKSGSEYKRIDSSSIYILSNTVFEIDTDEEIDVQNDIVLMVFSNVTVGDLIKDLYTFLRTHNHDKQDITSSIGHGNLINLIPVSSNPDIIYGGSTTTGSDHPQYIHREGYTDSDPGTYNNALLGDLFIASIDPTSLFNNILSDSNRLTFGSTSEGISLKHRAVERDLLLYSPENGLTISTKTGALKQSTALNLNGHEFYDHDGDLAIQPDSGLLKIAKDETTLADMMLDTLTSVAIISEAAVLDSMLINGILFSEDNLDVKVDGPGLFNIQSETWINDFGGVYTLDANSFIRFGDTSTFFTLLDTNTAGFVSANPLTLANTGKNTGVSSKKDDKEYFNIYSASPSGGNSTPSDHDTYVESGDRGTYYLLSTRTDQVEDNEVFSWQSAEVGKTRVDDLRSWPRAPVYAGPGSFKNLQVNTSSAEERKGVSFGDLNHMYVTGSGTACPSGWMVLESQNGVVIVDSTSDPIDCSGMSYGDLTAGDIQSFGSIIAEDDISAGGSLRVNSKIIGANLEITEDILVEGDSRFLGKVTFEDFNTFQADAQFNTNIDVKGSLDVGTNLNAANITATGISTFKEISRFESNVNIEKDLTIEGVLRSSNRVDISAKIVADEIASGPLTASTITTSETLYANGGIISRGDIDVNGNINVTNVLNVNTNLIVDDTVFAGKIISTGDITSSSDLTVESSATVKKDLTVGTNNGKFTSLGKATFSDDTDISGDLNTFGNTNLNGEVTVSSTAIFESSLLIKGGTDIESDLNVQGTVRSGPLEAAGLVTMKLGAIAEGLLQVKDINADGNISSSGDLQADRLIVSSGIDALTGSQTNLNNTLVSGEFSQTNPSAAVEFAGEATFNKTLEATGLITANSGIFVGSENAGVGMAGNAIWMSGTTAAIVTSNVFSNKLEGLTTPSIPDIILETVSSALGSALNTRKYITIADAYFDSSAVFAGQTYFASTIYVTKIKRLEVENDGLEWIDLVAKEAYYAP